MEQHRVSASPSVPVAPVQRSKAPAPRTSDSAADDPATVGGFSSLLSALGDGAAEDALQPDPSVLSHAAALLDVPLAAPSVQGANATSMAWQGADAWQLLSRGAAQSGSLATLSLADAAQRSGLMGAELLAQGGLVAQTARIDAAVEVPTAHGPGGAMAGYQRAFARLQNVLSQGVQSVPGVGAQAAGPGAAVAHRAGSPAQLSASTPPPTRPETHDTAAASTAPHAQSEAVGTTLLTQWLGAEPTVRPAGRPVSTDYGSGPQALGGPAPTAPSETALDGASALAEPSGASTEDAVTEQAAFWVGEDLQNAELTVTHEGMPVEVSVSLSGKEAHVAFRSDESRTRDLLDASQDQLRDMLGNEGLVLSGVSVGESGARQAPGEGAASPRGRAAGRVGVQVPVSEGAAEPSRRSAGVSDRAVDVFV